MPEPIEHLNIRLPADARRLLTEATEITGNTIAAFVLSAAIEKARAILESQRHFALSAAEWTRFVAALDDPPEPNDALAAAWRDYRGAGLE